MTTNEEPVDTKYTNIQVDSQILSTFMTCPRKADYIFNRKLVPIRGVSPSIERGQLAHIGVAAYWTEMIESGDYQKASIKGIEEAKSKVSTFKNIEPDMILETLGSLLKFFQHISTQNWIPLFVERHFKFLAYQDDSIKLRIYLTGRIDLGIKTPQIPIIPVDLKTESERWFYSVMSNQFKIYCLACNSNILGVQRFGFQKTLKDEEKYKMETLSFDPDILEEFRTEILPYYAKQLLMCSEDNFWPMNTSGCIHGHFKCQFSDAYNNGICSVSRNVREQKLERYFSIGQDWDPSEV